jgi:hypothetical protein
VMGRRARARQHGAAPGPRSVAHRPGAAHRRAGGPRCSSSLCRPWRRCPVCALSVC